MKVIGTSILSDYARLHPDVRSQIEAWLAEAKDARWATPIQVKERYGKASVLSGRRVVFDLKGNAYRLFVKISYQNQVITIKNIGTHEEYMKWNLEE